MATTKKTTTRRAPRKTTATSTTRSTSANPSLATRTGKAIAKRPVASAAIATGVVSGIAAAVAGFFAFKKSGKSFSQFSGDIATSVKVRRARPERGSRTGWPMPAPGPRTACRRSATGSMARRASPRSPRKR